MKHVAFESGSKYFAIVRTGGGENKTVMPKNQGNRHLKRKAEKLGGLGREKENQNTASC